MKYAEKLKTYEGLWVALGGQADEHGYFEFSKTRTRSNHNYILSNINLKERLIKRHLKDQYSNYGITEKYNEDPILCDNLKVLFARKKKSLA